MKKYFLDKKYKKVTTRVCIVLSGIPGIIGLILSPKYSLYPEACVICFLVAGGVWLLYGAIQWILKPYPDE